MMTLQVISEDIELLNNVADYLLSEQLIANAVISDESVQKTMVGDKIQSLTVFQLKGISKSLLFGVINKKLRERFQDRTPLLYSEPIILIDPVQTETLLEKLAKV